MMLKFDWRTPNQYIEKASKASKALKASEASIF
jgi:hypothetical protein